MHVILDKDGISLHASVEGLGGFPLDAGAWRWGSVGEAK